MRAKCKNCFKKFNLHKEGLLDSDGKPLCGACEITIDVKKSVNKERRSKALS